MPADLHKTRRLLLIYANVDGGFKKIFEESWGSTSVMYITAFDQWKMGLLVVESGRIPQWGRACKLNNQDTWYTKVMFGVMQPVTTGKMIRHFSSSLVCKSLAHRASFRLSEDEKLKSAMYHSMFSSSSSFSLCHQRCLSVGL